MSYVHSQNVYYGDMKPQNLLIFRDYGVKLGDFGISIKLNEKETADEAHCLKGMTPGYTFETFANSILNDDPVSRVHLLKNDYYALYQTFFQIYQSFKEKIDEKSYFYLMLNEVKSLYSLKDKRKLEDVLNGFLSKVEKDEQFIYKLS